MPERLKAVRLHEVASTGAPFKEDVVRGLLASPKSISCKWLYDEEGSRLFEEICKLPEYYLTRTENELLWSIGKERSPLAGTIIEYGSGHSEKVRALLEGVQAYVAIDIASVDLERAALSLSQDYPDLKVLALVADITKPLPLPSLLNSFPKPWVAFYAGSSIGNFSNEQSRFLLGLIRENLGPGDGLLIGIDLQKPDSILERAYDDAKGLTARFNKNLLNRIAKAFGIDISLESFKHVARYNATEGRMELFLECLEDQTWELGLGALVRLQKGEMIHTENSYKYTPEGFGALLESSGFRPQKTWTDSKDLFAVLYAKVC